MPAKECPTRTVGPSCRASTRWAEATASGSVVSGFCTAVTLSPAACSRAITSDQHDPCADDRNPRCDSLDGANWWAAATDHERLDLWNASALWLGDVGECAGAVIH